MLNFRIDPHVLAPLVPAGTELDSFAGDTFVSVVGFRFLATRVFGVSVPFHRDFEEVNLRFYVRRKAPEGWRRGVVFVKEIVPRRAIAFVARTLYGERYVALPMRHAVERTESAVKCEYNWRRNGCWESVSARATGEPSDAASGSIEEFITEHYWGYTSHAGGSSEYQVEHPRWRIWRADEHRLDCDIAALYRPQFVESLSAPASSAFIADGSAVIVRCRTGCG